MELEHLHQLAIAEWEKAVDVVRHIHRDVGHINADSSEYKKALEDVYWATQKIFEIKGTMSLGGKLIKGATP